MNSWKVVSGVVFKEGEKIVSPNSPDQRIILLDDDGVRSLVSNLLPMNNVNPIGVTYNFVGIPLGSLEPGKRTNGDILNLAMSLGYRIPEAFMMFNFVLQTKLNNKVVMMHKPCHGEPNNYYRLYAWTNEVGERVLGICSPFDSDDWVVQEDVIFVFLAPGE